MSQGLQENLSFYQFSRPERTLLVSSSTESPPSPGNSTRTRGPRHSRHPRPQLRLRPHSSGETSAERIRVQVVEEAINQRLDQIAHRPTRIFERSRSSEPADDQTLADPVTSTAKSYEPEKIPESPALLSSEAPGTPAGSTTSKRQTSRPLWTRTRSGGVWYLRQTNDSFQDNKSIRSTISVASKLDKDESSNITVVPLKPPPRPERLQTSPTNHIIIEQPFGHDQEGSDNAFKRAPQTSLVADRRRSSIDVKRLFSAPLTILRRSLREKSSRMPSPTPAQVRMSISGVSSANEPSTSTRDPTTVALDRVSWLLEGQRRLKSHERVHSYSHDNVSSTSSLDLSESWRSKAAELIGKPRVAMNKSFDRVAEIAPSILSVHMGSTPRNSPTEKATYRIKRRPSAESEEFLKIDISIRGGTSYLASEARRISTPPLPETRPVGKLRGFFFDYNAPDFSEMYDDTHETQQHSCTEGPNNYPHPESDASKHVTTHNKKSPGRPGISRAKTGDWYDTQLADLDATPGTDAAMSSEAERYHHCKHQCQARLMEIRRQQYEAQLDFDIPEHLPNSPLCPRNPRY